MQRGNRRAQGTSRRLPGIGSTQRTASKCGTTSSPGFHRDTRAPPVARTGLGRASASLSGAVCRARTVCRGREGSMSAPVQDVAGDGGAGALDCAPERAGAAGAWGGPRTGIFAMRTSGELVDWKYWWVGGVQGGLDRFWLPGFAVISNARRHTDALRFDGTPWANE